MAFILNNDQIKKLGTIIKDESNEKDLEYSATIVCQYSDILFGEGGEDRNQKQCNCDNKDASISCKERSILIRAGFIASMRKLKSEKLVNSQTMAKVIRIMRRLLRGANWLPIDCIVQKEMIEGLSLLVRTLHDFNSIRVLQSLLSSYLFWCYMQSEDKFVINNSKLLLCVTTWLKENNTSKNVDEIQHNEQKYGLTPASSELMNRIISDLNSSSEQYLKEYKLFLELNNSKDNETNELIELKKRIIKDLKLISALVLYSGVYVSGNLCSYQNNSINNTCIKNMCISNNNILIGTVILPQILELLLRVRSYTLELINCLVSEYLKNISTISGKYEIIDLIELLNIIITIRDGNENQVKSFIGVSNSDNNTEFVNKLSCIVELINISDEVLFNILECTGSTGIAVYSPLIQNYMLNIFSLECKQSFIISNSIEREKCHQFMNNYYSSIIFILMGVPVFYKSFKQYNYEVFLTFKSCISILRFYENLFVEILKIQEYVLSLINNGEIYVENNNILDSNSYHYNVEFNKKRINELLLKSMDVYELAILIVLEFRNTRLAKEIDQIENISKLINNCHHVTINVLYNIVINNCQVYSKLFSSNNDNSAKTALKGCSDHSSGHSLITSKNYVVSLNRHNNTLIELSYYIINIIILCYKDTDMEIDSSLLEKAYNIIKHLHFILSDNFIDQRIFNLFSLIGNKLYSFKQVGDNNDGNMFKRDYLKKSFIKDDSITFIDTDEKEEFQLDFLLDRNIPIESLYKDDDSLVYNKSNYNSSEKQGLDVDADVDLDVIMDIKESENEDANKCDKTIITSDKNTECSDNSNIDVDIHNLELNMESSSSSDNED
ncbi:putative secreted with long stretch of threonines mucin [Cryptosporidium bovis]|uniref:putative secreted with long stretch of threonines mucin n=1 Tax=Cryptosporidium bovis TaxID=310047 RepID=UPI00351A8115|nr:putative secreted with long stretch of threonines mucin [Cryptosporidium bovis]